jgi:hypothetical protein
MVPAASGFPQNSGTLIPEIWAGKLLTKFYAATALAEIANTDYEGEISAQGDKVNIRTTPDIDVKEYVKGQPLTYQTPETDLRELLIDKALYYGVHVDDIDKFQADVKFIEAWTGDAAKQVKIRQERLVYADIYADADVHNVGSTAGKESESLNMGTLAAPKTLTAATIIQFLVDVGTVLDEQNVPDEDRWIVLPWNIINMVKTSELKDASLSGDQTSILRNGRVGRIDRLTLYGSNLIERFVNTSDSNSICWNIIAGHKQGLSWAAQFTKTETLRAESTFGDFIRGLSVYGYEVLKPDCIVHAIAKRG